VHGTNKIIIAGRTTYKATYCKISGIGDTIFLHTLFQHIKMGRNGFVLTAYVILLKFSGNFILCISVCKCILRVFFGWLNFIIT
jgi:hypothetical protein